MIRVAYMASVHADPGEIDKMPNPGATKKDRGRPVWVQSGREEDIHMSRSKRSTSRRRFLTGAARAAIGLGAGGSLLGGDAKAAQGGQKSKAVAKLPKTAPAWGAPVVLLDSPWHIAPDPQNAGRNERWFGGPPVAGAKTIQLPSIIQEAFPGYHGVAWYWHEFVAPRHARKGGRYLLRFGAV